VLVKDALEALSCRQRARQRTRYNIIDERCCPTRCDSTCSATGNKPYTIAYGERPACTCHHPPTCGPSRHMCRHLLPEPGVRGLSRAVGHQQRLNLLRLPVVLCSGAEDTSELMYTQFVLYHTAWQGLPQAHP
jgi:hypothetical protein